MPRPRRTQISLEDTPYYHCCSRVVRHAFLCGDDAYSGKNYDHRKQFIETPTVKFSRFSIKYNKTSLLLLT